MSALTSLFAGIRLPLDGVWPDHQMDGSTKLRGSKTSIPRGALFWATQLTSVSFEVAFFVLLGYWGDQRWGTAPWLLLLGSVFGLLVSAWHLWQMVRSLERADSQKHRSSSR